MLAALTTLGTAGELSSLDSGDGEEGGELLLSGLNSGLNKELRVGAVG